ncbi:hypothetical protein GGI25_003924 [Coemansia spiralis]|uniref:Uncharacterized protein n=2 Tax=Coemansia TaxID=4863 RepID=A0A9W8KXW1_9FUNG|nr:hypothetical protein BX070DRAFT_237310 [Coemansia spiralis]KAJ1988988.1 hypothetical protein EDC05_004969 [Coemansia umbellata]KAJ2620935.1 hypothetical protein GGI26_004541 [Coemansia sp. RSA 1358]KAJ2675507.1 hypothetical protein GGI25_003924 [Coemansia spiralis]
MSKYSGKLGQLYQAYSQLVCQWPVDRLRPTHCYNAVLKRQMNNKFDKISAMHGEKVNLEMAAVENEIAALENLTKSKYKARYPVSTDMEDPVSNKGYYKKLLNSIDEAVKLNKNTSLRVD